MMRKVVITALAASAILAGVTRFTVPASSRRHYSWRIADFGPCLRCACDLEGNVSGVCPECGGAR